MNWNNPFKTKTIKTIKPGDKMFKISNGFMTSDRASIEITNDCQAIMLTSLLYVIAKVGLNLWHIVQKKNMF